jgi:hypothetical protein
MATQTLQKIKDRIIKELKELRSEYLSKVPKATEIRLQLIASIDTISSILLGSETMLSIKSTNDEYIQTIDILLKIAEDIE